MKNANIEFHPLARAEYLAALAYLDDRSSMVADRFAERFAENLHLIQSYPNSCPEIDPPIRKCVIVRYGYTLLYAPTGTGVYIAAVMHHSRKPGYWKDRKVDIPRYA